MTTAALVHVVVSGLATGSIYALVAISLVIIYNATRTLNFAQGEMLMISTFVGFTAYQRLRLPLDDGEQAVPRHLQADFSGSRHA